MEGAEMQPVLRPLVIPCAAIRTVAADDALAGRD
jgi:hypothetical protein